MSGAAGAMSNSCGFSLEGPVSFAVTGASGTLRSTWNFSPNSVGVAVINRSFTDSSGQTTTLPDSTVDTPCGGGAVNDWAGTFDQQ